MEEGNYYCRPKGAAYYSCGGNSCPDLRGVMYSSRRKSRFVSWRRQFYDVNQEISEYWIDQLTMMEYYFWKFSKFVSVRSFPAIFIYYQTINVRGSCSRINIQDYGK